MGVSVGGGQPRRKARRTHEVIAPDAMPPAPSVARRARRGVEGMVPIPQATSMQRDGRLC
jgi:hypothetical protein